MLEITLAAQGAFKAFELLKKGVAAGKEIEDMSGTVKQFFAAKHRVEKEVKAAEKRNTKKDMLVGSALEEAIDYVEEQQRILKMEEKIKWMYINAGKSAVWSRIKTEQAKIQRRRDLEASKSKAKASEDEALIRDLSLIAVVLVAGAAITGLILYLLLGS